MPLHSFKPAFRAVGIGLSAGLCITLALPPFNLVTFIGCFPVLLLWVVYRFSLTEALIAAYACGLLAMNQATYGVLGYDPWVWLLVFVVSPMWSLLPVWIICWVKCRHGITLALLMAPFAWVSVQTLLLMFAKLPLDIAVVFAYSLGFLQLASVLGSSVLTFIVVLTGALVTRVIIYITQQKIRAAMPYVVASVALPLASLAMGHALLDPVSTACVKRVAAAQPVIPVNWSRDGAIDPSLRKKIRSSLYAYLDEAASEFDFFIWPEGSGAFINFRMGEAREKLSAYAQKNQTHLFISAVDYDAQGQRYNSLFSLSPDNHLLRYDKQIPVPFAEQDLSPGSKTGIFVLDELSVGSLICFEVCFADKVQNIARHQPAFIMVTTSDMAFGISSLPELHLAMSILRAVENRTSVVHVANGGPSAIIDPYGRITARTDFMSKALLTGCVADIDGTSFYTRMGHLFPYAAMLVVLFLVSFVLLRGKTSSLFSSAEKRLSFTAVTTAFVVAVIVTLLVCMINVWFVSAKMKQAVSFEMIAKSLQPVPVLGPQPRLALEQPQMWGVDALASLINYYGVTVSWQALMKMHDSAETIPSLSTLETMAKKIGFKTQISQHSIASLFKEDLPVLVYMGKSRYAVLFFLDDDKATIYGRNFGYGAISLADLKKNWDGQVLRIQPAALAMDLLEK